MNCNSTPIQSIHRPLQWGVSLIELLIAVAILGVIAYIAIPIYNNYVDRTRVAEALTLVEIGKKAMVEYHSIAGKFPTSNNQAGIAHHNDIYGTYVLHVRIGEYSSPQRPGIRVRLRKNVETWGPKAKIFLMPRAQGGAISWSCCWKHFKDNFDSLLIPKLCPDFIGSCP